MVDALVDVCLRLGLKAFDYGLFLIKLPTVYQALKLELFEPLLDLAKRQLYSIELRTVRDNEYPRDAQLSHLVFDCVRLVRSQIVHHNGQPLARVDLSQSLEERDKVLLIYCFII